MALFMIFYKGKHTQLVITKKGGTHVANYNIGYRQEGTMLIISIFKAVIQLY